MKGIVFTEFLEMVEKKFGYAFVDQIIIEANLSSKGAYTSVGTYPHQELVSLLMSVHVHSQIPVDDLLKTFGNHLFGVFKNSYAVFFDKFTSAFDMLENIENHIHVEVKKLYPDAELPRFETERIGLNSLKMVYYSDRRMSALAEGLIESTLEYFNQKGSVKIEPVDSEGKIVTFVIKTED
ncbi:MAG: heme NO-binding domain-containing protein [Leadbetterella sp.]|nr:heme NO-binding domain-containing protein [Leadbetterella sp.]